MKNKIILKGLAIFISNIILAIIFLYGNSVIKPNKILFLLFAILSSFNLITLIIKIEKANGGGRN